MTASWADSRQMHFTLEAATAGGDLLLLGTCLGLLARACPPLALRLLAVSLSSSGLLLEVRLCNYAKCHKNLSEFKSGYHASGHAMMTS